MAEPVQYPRRLAAQILARVLSDREALDDVLASISEEYSPTQMAWLQEISSGTLRWKSRLDSILDSLSLKKKPTGWLRKILLIAAYQIVVQDRVYAGLVVSESVDLIRQKDGEAPARFANACLRKVSEYAERWRSLPCPSQPEAAASWASMPEWLWKRIVKNYGVEWAQAYALACLERPVTWLRAPSIAWRPEFAAEPGPIAGSWKLIEGGRIEKLAGFQQGQWIVQDISSQTLVQGMWDCIFRDRKRGPILQVLDLCAAPGGKSVALSWLGAQVSATDHNAKRFPLLKGTLERAAPKAHLLPWDQVGKSARWDWVFVDAPCSGTGIIRRHPDVRWLRQEKDVQSLTEIQSKLLKQAFDLTLPGGYVSYSVCSVLKEEGIGLIERLGLQNQVMQTWELHPQTAPFGDGFFAVLLKKP